MNVTAMRARARALASELTEFEGLDPRAIRRKALLVMRDAVDADFSTFFNVSEVDGQPMSTDVQAEGFPDNPWLEASIRKAPAAVYALFDLRRPPDHILENFDSAVRLYSRAVFQQTPIYEFLWKPAKAVDCAGLLVFHGPSYLGSPATLWSRPKDFGEAEREILAPLVKPVRAAITAAHCLSRHGLPSETGYVLVCSDGRFEHASAEGKAWLDREGISEAIRRRILDLDGGREPGESTTLENAEARVVRLQTKEGTRYLVCLRPAPLINRNPAELLTPLQLRIATSAASGATAAEIARDVDRSTEMVREHLDEIYRRLRVSTRVELARALSGEGPRA